MQSHHADETPYLEIMYNILATPKWGDRGLSRAEASALFRKHGFAPQTAGGWARSDWIETRPDGLRYVTESSRRWLAEQEG